MIVEILHLTGVLHADLKRDRRVIHRLSFGPGYPLDTGNPGNPEDFLCDLVQDQKVGWIPQIVIRLDQQRLGLHPRLREMSIRGGESLVGWGEARGVVPVVVAGRVRGQSEQTDQRDCDRGSQNGPRPANHDGADPSPAANLDHAFGVEYPETAADGKHRRS
ncbi:hypothetical protein [Mycobacterium marinum]|uniref:hypothetical protein n=1 Tax=Mycobacterium marinum TaxID=1781 RepID=UPI003BAF555C